ncbi:MAG: lysylphosphatidylglycerol synthase transmembrane domain-containing protein [Clostridia bacterium]|nr:lysylphosphatidylglycerol synthase transmembrane domain-containing protein [Clostridia bacterium]
MKYKVKIYKRDKLLKYASGTSKERGFAFNLFTLPKNFQKNIDEAEQAVAKQKSKKKKYISLIFFVINLVIIAVILGVQIAKAEDMSITTLLNSTFSTSIFLAMLVVWALSMMIESFRANILIKRSTGKSRPFLSYKVCALGRYYDLITPMATGGQPFQIFYLANRGLNASSAISVPMGRYVVNQIVLSLVWTIAMIVGLPMDLGPNFAFIKPLCVIGWFLNFVLIVGVVVLSVNQKLGKKLVIWVLKFLQKIKILKNYEKQYTRVIKTVTDFQATIKNFARAKGTFLLLVLSSFFYIFIAYSMAFLVYSSLVGFFDFSMWPYIILLGMLIDMAASFVPLPGGTGVSELTFTTLFAVILANSAMLVWALIFWKFMTYYIYLLQGILILAYDNFWGNQKYNWLKKKWELEAESMNFTQIKLHEFSQSKKKNPKKLV